MTGWLISNLGTILVTLLLAGIVTLIIIKMRKSKKQGVSPCCGSCSGCAMSAYCRKK